MSTILRISAVLLAIAAASACMTDAADAPQAPGDVLVWGVPRGYDVKSADGLQPTSAALFAAMPEDAVMVPMGSDADGLCGCDGAKCMEQWIKDKMGCGVCVLSVCEDGRNAGGCSVCDDSPRDAAGRGLGYSSNTVIQ